MPASATAKVTSAGPPSAAQPTRAVSAWPKASRPHGNPPHGMRPRRASMTTHSRGTVRTHHRRDRSPGSSAPTPAQNEAHSSDSTSHASGPSTRIQSSRSRKNTIPATSPSSAPRPGSRPRNDHTRAANGRDGDPPGEEVEGREREGQQSRGREPPRPAGAGTRGPPRRVEVAAVTGTSSPTVDAPPPDSRPTPTGRGPARRPRLTPGRPPCPAQW